MKALTLWQPWATLVAIGAKQYETRSWQIAYRGRLAIHAAKSKKGKAFFYDKPFRSALVNAGYPDFRWLAFGQIIAVCQLVDIIRITEDSLNDMARRELALGDFTLGRYAWRLQGITILPYPIPVRGRQGLWEWDYSAELPAMRELIEVAVT